MGGSPVGKDYIGFRREQIFNPLVPKSAVVLVKVI